MKSKYSLERWDHGYTLSGERGGIPLTALSECMRVMPKDAIIDPGIAHHLRQSGNRDVVLAICTKKQMESWREKIRVEIDHLPPQEKWWKGLDVGTSSASIFATFSDPRWKHLALALGKGTTPQDADDFGRCKRLLDIFPEWRVRLAKVGEEYPESSWPQIAEEWDRLESMDPSAQSELLRELNSKTTKETTK